MSLSWVSFQYLYLHKDIDRELKLNTTPAKLNPSPTLSLKSYSPISFPIVGNGTIIL